MLWTRSYAKISWIRQFHRGKSSSNWKWGLWLQQSWSLNWEPVHPEANRKDFYSKVKVDHLSHNITLIYIDFDKEKHKNSLKDENFKNHYIPEGLIQLAKDSYKIRHTNGVPCKCVISDSPAIREFSHDMSVFDFACKINDIYKI